MMNPSMPYTRSLSVAVQVAPEVAPLLQTELGFAGEEWSERLDSAVQAAVDALTAAEPFPCVYEVSLYLTTDAEISRPKPPLSRRRRADRCVEFRVWETR
jgi:hypothetical protein